MFDFWNNLSDSDKIAVVALAVSAFLGIVSMMISVCTLKQNSKMIENSTRPYITIYGQLVYESVKYVLILKNFGASSGIITKFTSDTDLSGTTGLDNIKPFGHIVGTNLVPNQSICCDLDLGRLKKNNISTINFEIEYQGVKKYSEKIVVNITATTENTRKRYSVPATDTDIKKIAKSTQFIADALNGIEEKML